MTHLSPLGAARMAFAKTHPLHANLQQTPQERFLESLSSAPEQELPPEYIHLAGAMVAWEQTLDDSEQRALTLLLLTSLDALSKGSVRIPVLGAQGRSFLEESFARLLASTTSAPDTHDTPARATANAQALLSSEKLLVLLGAPGEEKPLILEASFLYQHRSFQTEVRVAENLAALALTPTSEEPLEESLEESSIEAALAEVVGQPSTKKGVPIRLSDEQQSALLLALRSPVSVISGGPGTGKTSIIVSALRVFVRLGFAPQNIALTAPTGKAAKRMQSAIHEALDSLNHPTPEETALRKDLPAPQTLHRLLGYSPWRGGFRRDEASPLNAQLIIVDETSMIDLSLMDSLTRAIPLGARLILLGDADQLPSVRAGAVLRDLIPQESPSHLMQGHAVQLQRSFRMDPNNPAGRHILTVARGILAGDPGALLSNNPEIEQRITRRSNPKELKFFGAELIAIPPASPDQHRQCLDDFFTRWHRERLRAQMLPRGPATRIFRFIDGTFSDEDQAHIAQLLQKLERFRILCLTRHGISGVFAANAALHLRSQYAAKNQQGAFSPGEPILMTKNDPDRQLFNGDQGIALRVQVQSQGLRREPPRLMFVFPRGEGFVPFLPSRLSELVTLAHAITVHKSQGSEYDEVVVLLPDREGPLLIKELLYTAITRSRKSVVIIGEERLLRLSIQRGMQRFSGLHERLEGASETSTDDN